PASGSALWRRQFQEPVQEGRQVGRPVCADPRRSRSRRRSGGAQAAASGWRATESGLVRGAAAPGQPVINDNEQQLTRQERGRKESRVSYQTEEEQIERIKDVWQRHGAPVLTGVVLALAGVFGWNAWNNHQENKALNASAIYQSMLESVLQD